ncbi:Na+/H+ antiporter NhaC family protein [uncultured Clostridium sp.]|uniref:Na+/H+ antiporter NhaC family protein n=1 Tax=uncultured Clostridium sp. TaxID=59620 RepID=UPI0028E55D3B|nr:Na+/H+ antiporter NhaC family protein [uncultured Clostridium sp.]
MSIQAIGILVVFLVSVILMMTRKLPTILVLPLMAVIIALIAGIPLMSSDPKTFSITANVLEAGSMRLSSAIAGLIFGAWFGQILNKVGVTKTIIRKAAETAGDKPVVIALTFLIAASIIFSAASGLGMVILIGTIIIPIMLTAGLSPLVSALVLLFANAIGVTFYVGGWAIYKDVLKLTTEQIANYSLIPAIPLIIVAVVTILYYNSKGAKFKKAWSMPLNNEGQLGNNMNVRSIALISPIIPVILAFTLKLSIVPSVVLGIVITLILATPKRPVHVLSSALIEGIQDTAGALALLIGIGMVLNAVMAEPVAAILKPMIETIIPHSPLTYILVFTLLSPLAIYRGPFNIYGLGSGIAALLVAAGMNPVAAMVALRVNSNLQAVCDPTNSHNVWVSDYTKTDVNEILKKTIIWLVAAVGVSMVVASFIVTL